MRSRPFVWTVAVFAVALFIIERGIDVGQGGRDRPEFFIDEAHKLGEAYYFHLFFEQRDVRNRDWQADFYARTNPPVAKYIFGAALALAGQHVDSRQTEDDFGRLWAKPEALRKLVPDEQLLTTRRVSALYAALACAALFFMAFTASGPAAGIAAVVLLLTNRSFMENARRGMADSILLFHLSLIGPSAIVAARALSRWWARGPRRATTWSSVRLALQTVALPGLVIALATGTKLNGAMTGPIYLLCLVLVALRGPGVVPLAGRLRTTLVAGVAAGLLAVAAFVAINPYFYPHPLGAALHTLRAFEDWMVAMQISPGEGLFSGRERVAAMFDFLFTQKAAPFSRWLSPVGPYCGVLLTLFGAAALFFRRPWVGVERASEALEDRRGAMDVVFVWALVCLILPTEWAPVAWDRYFFPPYVAACLLAGIGLTAVGHVGLRIGGFNRQPAFSRGELRLAGLTVLSAATIAVAVVSAAWGRSLEARPEVWDAPGGISPWSDSARLRRHLAQRAMQMGKPQLARAQLERALGMLPVDQGDRSQAAVERACLLYDLSAARSKSGDQKGAVEALTAHVAMLQRFREGMRSNDPFVRGGSRSVIAGRNAELVTLRGAAAGVSTAETLK